jgi:hypothetical protein
VIWPRLQEGRLGHTDSAFLFAAAQNGACHLPVNCSPGWIGIGHQARGDISGPHSRCRTENAGERNSEI